MSVDSAVDDGHDPAIARIAAALCAASRWVVVTAVALTILAAVRFVLFRITGAALARE